MGQPGIDAFIVVDYPEPHRDRARRILRDHPEVKRLFGRNPWTAAWTAALVALQIALAWTLADRPWWAVLAVAFAVGAYADHALYVMIHEVAHHLIFKRKPLNQLVGLLANVPLVVPSSASFALYHLKHHKYQGDFELDADLAGRLEAKLIGRDPVRKLLWEALFPFFQTLRTYRFSRSGKISFVTGWVILNIVVQFSLDGLLVWWLGPKALAYLVASLFFSIGPHPLGARWIQEHYVVHGAQETYSYYGPANLVAFNVGFHNEHHDFPFIAWNRLPELKALAPEAYDTLHSHASWTRLWLRFLFDPKLSLHTRVTRDARANERRAPALD